MKLTENTKVRVRVPKHLYEAIQAELDMKHEMEEGDYGHDATKEGKIDEVTGMEMELSKIGNLMGMDPFLAMMVIVGALFIGAITLPKAIALARTAIGVARKKGDKVLSKVKNLFFKLLKPKFEGHSLEEDRPQVLQFTAQLAKEFPELKSEPVQKEADEAYELEEVLDLETLMEAVKDASKKKAEDKKKKELEAKKKKEADDKKKKEAEAKKKADAKKK